MSRWLTESYLWDLLITRQWEKMGTPEEREERSAAARGILTKKALEKERDVFVAAAKRRLHECQH